VQERLVLLKYQHAIIRDLRVMAELAKLGVTEAQIEVGNQCCTATKYSNVNPPRHPQPTYPCWLTSHDAPCSRAARSSGLRGHPCWRDRLSKMDEAASASCATPRYWLETSTHLVNRVHMYFRCPSRLKGAPIFFF
jgi:hypothetical protein